MTIGIASSDVDLYSPPNSGQPFWGFFPCSGTIIGLGFEKIEYGESCIVNDVIGILFEIEKNQGQLTFYHNQVKS